MLALTILVFILILGLLVFVHELGHFISAKLSGIKVEEFAFGFPPRLICVKRGETDYCINAIPLGGYVKMLGEDAADGSPKSFSSKKPRIRLAVVTAGVIMNFVLAGVLFSIGYSVGMTPISLDPEKLIGEKNTQVVVAEVFDNSPAKSADIQLGDLILGYKSLADFSSFTKAHLGQTITVNLKRKGAEITKTVTVSQNPDTPLGVGIADIPIVKMSVGPAIVAGFKEMALTTANIAKLLGVFLVNLFRTGSTGGEVSGPVGIFKVTGQAVRMGFGYIIQLAALLSINLGLINILPVPALDGGRAVLIIAEGIFRRKVIKAEIENFLHLAGFVVLIILILAITAKEIIAYF
jgi:regulator of sigma E protease